MAYKRPRNIKDIHVLVESKFSEPSDFKFFSSKCKRPRYTHCSRIVESDHFLSSQKCTSFKLNYDKNCTTRNVIYLISCKKCDKQCVGQTRQQVSKRMNSTNLTSLISRTQISQLMLLHTLMLKVIVSVTSVSLFRTIWNGC